VPHIFEPQQLAAGPPDMSISGNGDVWITMSDLLLSDVLELVEGRGAK
jgi:hypothetical protein